MQQELEGTANSQCQNKQDEYTLPKNNPVPQLIHHLKNSTSVSSSEAALIRVPDVLCNASAVLSECLHNVLVAQKISGFQTKK